LERLCIPAIHEISLEAVASGLSVGENEVSRLLVESGNIPRHSVVNRWQSVRIPFRTRSTHDEVEKDDVDFVISAIHMLPIPTRSKHQLGTKTIGSLVVKNQLKENKGKLLRESFDWILYDSQYIRWRKTVHRLYVQYFISLGRLHLAG
jgi:hypothetical protein